MQSSPLQNEALFSSVPAGQWKRHGKMRVWKAATKKGCGRI